MSQAASGSSCAQYFESPTMSQALYNRTEEIDDTARRLSDDGWEEIIDEGFVGLAGPFFRKSVGENVVFGFPTFAKHRNHGGVLQGGALATFADRAIGLTVRANSGAMRTATVQLAIQYLDAVAIGEFVEARPTIARRGKQLVFVNASLTVGRRAIASVTGIWRIILSARA